jgi:S-formylglutathione hydrolase FrmB
VKHLLLAVTVAACSSSPPVEAKPPAKGRVDTVRFHSDALGVDKQVVVYVPGDYDAHPERRYPVFYYLHGLGGDETNWVKVGHLDDAADTLGLQAIVVMPDGDDSFYVDSPAPSDYDACLKDGTGFRREAVHDATCVRKNDYETYITRDLVGWADKTYRTIAKRDSRAIAGLSMGGYGALMLGMRHPDVFAAAASHSGVDALLYKGPHPYATGKAELETDVKEWGKAVGDLGAWIRSRFGDDVAFWRDRDPAALVDRLAPGKLALYLDCGTEDDFLLNDEALYLHDLLVAKHIDHSWYLGPGRHDFAFWSVRVAKSLAFLRDHTGKS